MTGEKSSQISGFYKLSVEERLKNVQEFSGLSDDEIATLRKESSLEVKSADKMIENVIGVMPVPLGVATNFFINGRDRSEERRVGKECSC